MRGLCSLVGEEDQSSREEDYHFTRERVKILCLLARVFTKH